MNIVINKEQNHADILGSNNPFFGKKHSVETKAKMKEQRLGKKWIHNINSGERMLVKESEIEKFVNLGWIKGKGK